MIRVNQSLLGILCILLIMVSGCSAMRTPEASSSPDYEQLKQMVKDILQTEDGKKAIMETLKDEKVKEQLIIDGGEVTKTVQETLLSPKGMVNFQQMMADPKFSSELAKSLQKENEKLHKDLMKDPEYQKMLIDVMKDPEFEKNLMELMKSSAYRQQMMLVMKEALQSPLFQDDLMKLLSKVQEEAMKPKKKEGGEEGGGQGGGEGGGGGS